MYIYRVKVKANLPYPIEQEYRVECWKLWTAISRGIKLFRAEDKIRGKKLSNVAVTGERIGAYRKDYNEPEVIEQEEEYEEKELTEAEREQFEEQIAKNTVVLKA